MHLRGAEENVYCYFHVPALRVGKIYFYKIHIFCATMAYDLLQFVMFLKAKKVFLCVLYASVVNNSL